MPEAFVEAFVDKLILLEKETGAKVRYGIMAPFNMRFCDCMDLQLAAKQIADFIGLKELTFIVAATKQQEKTGGHIDLSTNGREVFIEVDSEMMGFPDVLIATLCHEVCHKWLQIENIRVPIEIDNEILTDITCVFLGLGKMMLNGCLSEKVRSEATVNGTRTITETKKVGYLDRSQLAFVYSMVCAMRKVPKVDMLKDLNSEAREAVQVCDFSFNQYYDARFHGIEVSQGCVPKMRRLVDNAQYVLADLNKHSVYIKQSFCETIDLFLKKGYEEIELLNKKTAEMVSDSPPDPALCFLQNIKSECEVNRWVMRCDAVSDKAKDFLQHAKSMGHYLSRNSSCFPQPSSEMFNIIMCPQDGTRLRLPENRGNLTVTCPTCKYRFGYNTRVVLFSDSSEIKKMSTWGERVRDFFGLK